MVDLDRRTLLTGTAATAAALAASSLAPAPAPAQTPKKGGTLRFIPIGDLKILDPIWTTAYITRDHGYMVYDTLFANDASLQPRPQMVDKYEASRDRMKWSFTLRDGLRFHDGQPVTAEDCVASLLRWGKRDALGRMSGGHRQAPGGGHEAPSCWSSESPFGIVLEALAKPSSNVPFIMPARLAATPDTEQVKDAIGSGPFKFVKEQWQPGHEAVYVKNTDYVPRSEPASGAAGGKVVYLDRVVWRYQPDPATASAALRERRAGRPAAPARRLRRAAGEEPEHPGVRLGPDRDPGLAPAQSPAPALRQQEGPAGVAVPGGPGAVAPGRLGQPRFYRTCPAYFMCGSQPYESAVGAPRPDLGRARQLLKEGGYDGRPLVVLDPTDRPEMHGACLVLRDQLQKIGPRSSWCRSTGARSSPGAPRRRRRRPEAGTSCTPPGSPPTSTTPPSTSASPAPATRPGLGWSVQRADGEAPERLASRPATPASASGSPSRSSSSPTTRCPTCPGASTSPPRSTASRSRASWNFPAAVLWNVWLDT